MTVPVPASQPTKKSRAEPRSRSLKKLLPLMVYAVRLTALPSSHTEAELGTAVWVPAARGASSPPAGW